MVNLHQHNAETYQRMVSLFAECDRVCAVAPTGTGKSFLILKLIEDNPNKRFLITAPNNYVFGQIKSYAQASGVNLSKCEFLTYTALYETANLQEIPCDFLITDEFHRLGATTWNEGIKRFLACHHCKVFGTSATPIRYLDSMRDMAEELFRSNYAVNMSLSQAIEKKILPLPVYVTTIYSFWGELAELERRAEKTNDPRLKHFLAGKIHKAKTMISSLDCGIETVFSRHMKNKSGKYIVFCPDIDKLSGIYDECNSWFCDVNANIHKYSVYAKNSNSNDEFDNFCNDSDETALKLLFCIDMLNEGIHIENIDGVIMLRPTQSANVFYQQLGRALSCSLQDPVIFDIVNNYETGDTAKQYEQIMLSDRKNGVYGEVNIEFEIYDYIRDIRDILTELRNTFESSWDFTYDTLCRYIAENGNFPTYGVSYEGLQIGKWCSAQRVQQKSGSLLPERKRKLDEIGFIWDQKEEKWYYNYRLLRSYIKENGKMPTTDYVCNGIRLGAWCNAQRSMNSKGTLSAERKRKLDELGFVWNQKEEKWNKFYQRMERYVNEHGKLPTRAAIKTSPQIHDLYIWRITQMNNFQSGYLSKEQIVLLKKLGFKFKSQTNDNKWLNNYEKLKNYITEHGEFPKSCDTSDTDSYKIYRWVSWERKMYAEGKLDENQIRLLNELGIIWNVKAEFWETNFELLSRYYEENGRVPSCKEKIAGRAIGQWYHKLVRKYANGELPDDIAERFRVRGIPLEAGSVKNSSANWFKCYSLFKEYFSEFRKIPAEKEVYKNAAIGNWYFKTLQAYHEQRLKPKGMEMMKELEKYINSNC